MSPEHACAQPTGALLGLLRAYFLHFPIDTGKGIVQRMVLEPLLPREPRSFLAKLPTGDDVELMYREAVGIQVFVHGAFEPSEVSEICSRAKPGTTVFDVGANVGVFALQLARAVAPDGIVQALEPLPANVARLHANIRRNTVQNVVIVQSAAGSNDSSLLLHLSDDGAYGSTGADPRHRNSKRAIPVPSVRLDTLWQSLGQPRVSVIKVDVEGGGADVVRGGRRIISSEAPTLLVEATTDQALEAIVDALPREYAVAQPTGFEPWNYLPTVS